MSNRPPALLLILWCSPVFAQSQALLDAVRVHRPGVREQAATELKICLDAKPTCAEADRLSMLSGFLSLAESDAPAAVTQLSSRAAPKGLEAYHAWYLAEAQAYAGKTADALKTFATLKKKAPQWMQKRIDVRTGELLLWSGKAAKAVPLLEPAADEDPSAELLFERGLARVLAGNKIKGTQDLRTVVVKFPNHPHAEQAMQRLLSTGKPPAFAFDERLARVNGFLSGGNPTRAMEELELAVAPTGRAAATGKARLTLTRAVILFALKKEDEAYAQIELALAGPPSVAADAMMMRARRAMRAGENRVARELLQNLDQKYPNEGNADEAAYLAAWLTLQAGEFVDAAAQFDRFENRYPSSRKKDEARWYRAYSLYRGAQHQASRDVLASLVSDFPKSQLVPQAKYWMVRSLQKATTPADGGTGAASLGDDYRAVMASAPGTFYALLASERLRELNETVPAYFPNPPAAMTVETPKELKLAQLLARTGLFRDAAEESQRTLSSVSGQDAALRFGHALQQVGEFGAAHTLAARWLWGQAYGQKTPEALQLMYPQAFKESVEKSSEARKLDPFLAWAIMRRESAFRPDVYSAADARGLMQIIPPTARAIAKELKAEPPSPEDLFSPEANISLGTWYLTALLDRFKHPTLMAAAYNAGPTPVARWAVKNPDLALDEWVEEIPYKETRIYVKQVTADYFIYRQLYARDAEPARLSLRVPTPGENGVTF